MYVCSEVQRVVINAWHSLLLGLALRLPMLIYPVGYAYYVDDIDTDRPNGTVYIFEVALFLFHLLCSTGETVSSPGCKICDFLMRAGTGAIRY